jgi:hypothetical protein
MCRTLIVHLLCTPLRTPAPLLLLMLALVVPQIAAKRQAKPADPPAQQPADPDAAPIPPKDARWTLYCQAIGGADHVERAKAIKQQLIELTKKKDWYVIHQETDSVVYFGFYRTIEDNAKDRKEYERAQGDRKMIESLASQQGDKIFTHVFFVEAASPDPLAPPEWDLRNADGYWSIEVGVYKDSPQRKQAAVEAVRDARKNGVPAYYYHGPTASSVCIGIWPREAVREEGVQGDPNDPNGNAIVAPDSAHDVVILPQPLDPSLQIKNRDGQRVRELTPRNEIVDPSLQVTMAKYPTHAVNGEVLADSVPDPQNPSKMITQPKPSLLVKVPKEAPSLLRQNTPAPSLVGPTSPSQTPGTGTLRSIGQ